MTLHFDKFRLVGLQLLCIVIFFQYRLNDFFFIFLFEDFQNLANLIVRSCMVDFRLNFLYNLSILLSIFIHNSRFDTFFCIIEKLKRIYYNAKRMAKTIVEIEEQKAVMEEAA
jgi:hypothetical protein